MARDSAFSVLSTSKSHLFDRQISPPSFHIKNRNDLIRFDITVTGSNFEITFVSEKHVVEDDVLFTNHLAGK